MDGWKTVSKRTDDSSWRVLYPPVSDLLDDLSTTRCWFGVKVGASPTGSRRSNTENQRNDLISNDCGTIASPCRRVTICIHDYRPRKAERTRGKKGWIPWERQVEAKCQKCTYIRLHSTLRFCIAPLSILSSSPSPPSSSLTRTVKDRAEKYRSCGKTKGDSRRLRRK